MREISVEGLEIIGYGSVSTTYKANDEQIIKVFDYDISEDEAENIIRITEEMSDRGIPVMKVYEVVRAGGRIGIIAELLGPDTVGMAVMKDPSSADMYARKMGKLLKKMHGVQMPEGLLPSMKERLMEWVDSMEADQQLGKRKARIMRDFIGSVPDSCCVLHCDFHEGNLMLRGDELVLTDIEEICIGNPLYEMGCILGNHDVLTRNPELLKETAGVDPKTSRRMCRQMMREYYGRDDERFYRRAYKIFFMICMLMYSLTPARFRFDNSNNGEQDKILNKEYMWLIKNITQPLFCIMWLFYRRRADGIFDRTCNGFER